MSDPCDALRPLLADFLTDALEPAERERLEAHLPECPACSEELVALLELGEGLEALGAEAPASPEDEAPELRVHRGGGGRIAAALIAAALLLFLGWFAQRTPRARLVVAGAEVRRLAPGDELVAKEKSRLLLPCGSEVEIQAGATLRFLGERELALDTGVGWFHVAKSGEPFLVRARGARVRVLGTSFRVEVEEVDMTPRQGAALGAAVIVAVASGIVIFETHQGSEELHAGQGARAVTTGAITRLASEDDIAARIAPLEEARAALAAENAELKERERALTARVAELEAKLASVPKAAPKAGEPTAEPAPQDEAATPPKEKRGPRVSAGSNVEQSEALAKVDWSRAGEGAAKMFPHLAKAWRAVKEGKALDSETQKALYVENQKLVEVVLELQGKVPTHTSGNGEFTHPLVTVNLMAEHLERAQVPFDDDQLRQLSRIGEDYELAWGQAQSRYGERTPAVRKLADELILKRDAMLSVERLLTAAQRREVVLSEGRHISRLDIYSPVMAVILNGKPVAVTEDAPLRASLEQSAKTEWALSGADLAASGPALDAWARALEPELLTIPQNQLGTYTLDEAVRGAVAQADAADELLRVLPADSDAAKAILAAQTFTIPRRVAASK